MAPVALFPTLSRLITTTLSLLCLGLGATPAREPTGNENLQETLRMLEAHAGLRSEEASNPEALPNRLMLETMLRKALRAPSLPLSFEEPPAPASNFPVGTLQGQFSVNNKGAANYSLTLPIPEPANGLAPSLSLYYSSLNGCNELGHGFVLSTGFETSITRGRTILARDKSSRIREYASSDRLYLDGKRLLCIGNPDTYWTPGASYRTEVDSFYSVNATGSEAQITGFVTESKWGRLEYYGQFLDSNDACWRSWDETSGSLSDKIHSYALKRVEDKQGNHIDFHYRSLGLGEWVLDHIDYGGGPANPPVYSIRCTYSSEPCTRSSFASSLLENQSVRLDNISVLALQGEGEAQLITRYDLEYDGALGEPRTQLVALSTGQANSPGGLLLPFSKMRFEWSSEANRCATPSPLPLTKGFLDTNTRGALSGDFSGDGKTDFAVLNNGLMVYASNNRGATSEARQWASPTLLAQYKLESGTPLMLAADIDGDRLDDLLLSDEKNTALLLRSCGDHFELFAAIQLEALLGNNTPSLLPECRRLSLADLDGDGRADLLIHSLDGNLHAFLAQAKGFSAEQLTSAPETSPSKDKTALPRESALFALTPFIGDINGDGLSDYAWLESRKEVPLQSTADAPPPALTVTSELKLRLSLPEGGFSAPLSLATASEECPDSKAVNTPALQVIPGDYNNDDKTDFLCALTKEAITAPNAWTLYLSKAPNPRATLDKAEAFRTIKDPLPSMPHRWSKAQLNRYPLDLNHDGIDDLLWWVESPSTTPSNEAPTSFAWWVTLGKGDGHFGAASQDNIPSTLNEETLTISRQQSNQGQAAPFAPLSLHNGWDLNGDGLADWVLAPAKSRLANAPLSAALATPLSERCPLPHLVTDIINGLGERIAIGYKAGLNDDFYTPAPSVPYPQCDLRTKYAVVSDKWGDTGGPTPSHFSYQYAGLRLDYGGRGNLGFLAFTTLDHQTGFLKYQFLSHSFPMTGLTRREQTYVFFQKSASRKFKLLNSTDNHNTFDAVVDPTTLKPYGSLFPFEAYSIKHASANNEEYDYSFDWTAPLVEPERQPLFSGSLPQSLGNRESTENWFDGQPKKKSRIKETLDPQPQGPELGAWNSQNPPARPVHFPQLITYGNSTQKRSTTREYITLETTSYYPPNRSGSTYAGREKSEYKSLTNRLGRSLSNSESRYTYYKDCYLYETEVSEESSATTPRKVTRREWKRDDFGRLLRKEESKQGDKEATLLYQVHHYDPNSGLAIEETDSDGDQYKVEYNLAFGKASRILYSEENIVNYTYDEFGRTYEVTNKSNGYHRFEELFWTNEGYEDWRKSQRVKVPAQTSGIEGHSVYASRNYTPGKPLLIKYFDRLNRLIRSISEAEDKKPQYTDIVYNELGQTVAESQPYEAESEPKWTIKTYDLYGLER